MRGQMEYGLRPAGGHSLPHAASIQQVNTMPRILTFNVCQTPGVGTRPHDRVHLVSGSDQTPRKTGPDKAGGPGDQDSFARRRHAVLPDNAVA